MNIWVICAVILSGFCTSQVFKEKGVRVVFKEHLPQEFHNYCDLTSLPSSTITATVSRWKVLKFWTHTCEPFSNDLYVHKDLLSDSIMFWRSELLNHQSAKTSLVAGGNVLTVAQTVMSFTFVSFSLIKSPINQNTCSESWEECDSCKSRANTLN